MREIHLAVEGNGAFAQCNELDYSHQKHALDNDEREMANTFVPLPDKPL